MSHCLKPILVALAVIFMGNVQVSSANEPAMRFEIRRAETKSDKGLEEATLPKSEEKIYLHKKAEVTEEDIASAGIEEENSRPFLKLTFTEKGAAKVEKLTKEHRDKPIAILVDGKLLVAPIIRSTISNHASLTGFDKKDLERIVKGLKAK